MKPYSGDPTKLSSYKATNAWVAKKLVLMGFDDESVAEFFGIDMETMAAWAWEYREFFDSITPSPEDIAEYAARRRAVRDKINAGRRQQRQRPVYRIVNAMRARIWAALRGRSDGALFSRLPYSRADLMAHLESQFWPGMSWENYGRWHVDHRRPCASYDLTDSTQFLECWALENLSPLWAEANIKKGARYVGA